MRTKFLNILFVAMAILFVACNNEINDVADTLPNQRESGRTSSIARQHTQPVILGEQKNNPFSVENMKLALEAIIEHGDEEALDISTRSAEAMVLALPTTDLYVRFLPADTLQYELLLEEGLELFDFPLDFDIVQHGDFYKDPTLNENAPFTWQYTVVKPAYIPPAGIRYEVIEELFIPENSEFYTEIELDPEEGEPRTRMARTVEDIQNRNLLKAMLHVSFELTGNGDELQKPDENETRSTHTACYRRCIKLIFTSICWTDCDTWYHPDGFVRINTPPNGGLVGVQGIRVRVWRWFTIEHAYTDANGYYRIARRFDKLWIGNNASYKVFFEGRHPHGINWEMNRSLFGVLPLWTIRYGAGCHSPNGHNITFNSGGSYWGKAVVHNAYYEYITEARRDGISLPPNNMEIAIKHISNMGDRDQSAPLLRKHINMSIIKAMPNWIGFVGQVFGYTLFGAALPDLILNHSSVRDEYNHIRSNVWHELTHASQLRRMTSDRGLLWASEYWSENVYVQASNSNAYGSKGGRSWQIIALSEGWANYRERIVLAERFNTNRKLTENPFPPFPRNYAFMFRDLANLGISQGELERALSTWTIAGYRDNLIARHPNLITQITDIVNRYL